MEYAALYRMGVERLAAAGIEEAKLDARLLLEELCGTDRNDLLVHGDRPVTEEQEKNYVHQIELRSRHIPLQHITGYQEFMGLRFKVTPDVLIPRQDTETLVEEALKAAKPGMNILDMCTGSGCVLISILKNVDAKGIGYDISKQALNVAKENAKRNHVVCEFERSDLFENVDGTYDIIVSNPPYIPTEVIHTLMPEVKEFEPMEALDGMEDGLHFYRRIVREAKEHLAKGGYLMLEIGHDQGASVSEMLEYGGYAEVRVIKDLARNDRVVIGKRV